MIQAAMRRFLAKKRVNEMRNQMKYKGMGNLNDNYLDQDQEAD